MRKATVELLNSHLSMFSINMRIFKTVLLIAYLGAGTRCLPVDGESATTESKTEAFVPSTTEAIIGAPALPTTQSDVNYYDQRQNGSENYRIHVDGVVLVFAPIEALLLAGATAGATASTTASTLLIPEHSESIQLDSLQPEKPNVDLLNKTEPASSKTIHR